MFGCWTLILSLTRRWQLSLCTHCCGPHAEGGGASHSGSPLLHKGWVCTESS